MNKISNIGTGVGITIIILSIARWFFLFYDPSQMALGISIGIIVCGFSYIYDWMRKVDKKFNKQEKRMDVISNWWIKEELK